MAGIGDLTRDLEILKEEMKTYGYIFARTGATEASRLFVEATKRALASFYGSYSPKFYDREYNIMNNSYSPYLHNSGRYYSGGVRLSPARMHTYYKQGMSTGEIWNRVINEGLHGIVQTEAPESMIAAESDSIAQAAYQAALAAAAAHGYQILSRFI